MADYENAAYDLSLFETRKAATAPDIRKKPDSKPQVVRERTQTRIERRAEEHNRRRTLARLVFICVIVVTMLGAVLQSRVTLVKNAAEAADKEAVLAASISEGVRLNTKLNSLVSTKNVELYARNKGMKKIESYQKIVIAPYKGDEIIEFIGKPVD